MWLSRSLYNTVRKQRRTATLTPIDREQAKLITRCFAFLRDTNVVSCLQRKHEVNSVPRFRSETTLSLVVSSRAKPIVEATVDAIRYKRDPPRRPPVQATYQ